MQNQGFTKHEATTVTRDFIPNYSKVRLYNPFAIREDDDLPGMSREDILFKDITSNGITVNQKENLEMSLPLKPSAEIPHNKWDANHNCIPIFVGCIPIFSI